jgi:hypothetical protein
MSGRRHFLLCASAAAGSSPPASPAWHKALPLELLYPFVLLFSKPHSQGRYTGCNKPIGWAGKMSHTSREKLDLVNRTKKVIGQLESVLRALT